MQKTYLGLFAARTSFLGPFDPSTSSTNVTFCRPIVFVFCVPSHCCFCNVFAGNRCDASSQSNALSRSMAARAKVFMINFFGAESVTLKVLPKATISIAFSAGSFLPLPDEVASSMSLTSLMLRALRTTARPTVTRNLKLQFWKEQIQ